jgi:hypothetical protein
MKRFLMTAISLFFVVAMLATQADSNLGVGAQYDTTHVYVQPEEFDKFVASLLATLGRRCGCPRHSIRRSGR